MRKQEKQKPEKTSDMTIFEHLGEMRSRFIRVFLVFFIVFILSYCYSDVLCGALLSPLYGLWDGNIIYTNITEPFITHVKVASYFALWLTIPYLFIEIYLFAAPGLYMHEKWCLRVSFFIAPILFALGGAFAYLIVMPLAWNFFITFSDIDLYPKLSDYMSISLLMMTTFGIMFQFPLILFLLIRFGIVSREFLKRNRRFAIVVAFILAAVLTPPDIISQVMLAIPLILVYELSILLCRNCGK